MTARKAAKAMLEVMNEYGGELRQDDAAMYLAQKFGEEFTYFNKNGNLAIKKEVLAEFRELTPDHVWVKGRRYWRPREGNDDPGRDQKY